MHSRILNITGIALLIGMAAFTIYRLPQAWRDEQAFNQQRMDKYWQQVHKQHLIAGR